MGSSKEGLEGGSEEEEGGEEEKREGEEENTEEIALLIISLAVCLLSSGLSRKSVCLRNSLRRELKRKLTFPDRKRRRSST